MDQKFKIWEIPKNASSRRFVSITQIAGINRSNFKQNVHFFNKNKLFQDKMQMSATFCRCISDANKHGWGILVSNAQQTDGFPNFLLVVMRVNIFRVIQNLSDKKCECGWNWWIALLFMGNPVVHFPSSFTLRGVIDGKTMILKCLQRNQLASVVVRKGWKMAIGDGIKCGVDMW